MKVLDPLYGTAHIPSREENRDSGSSCARAMAKFVRWQSSSSSSSAAAAAAITALAVTPDEDTGASLPHSYVSRWCVEKRVISQRASAKQMLCGMDQKMKTPDADDLAMECHSRGSRCEKTTTTVGDESRESAAFLTIILFQGFLTRSEEKADLTEGSEIQRNYSHKELYPSDVARIARFWERIGEIEKLDALTCSSAIEASGFERQS
ncbi:hypothetical protein T265_03422 [Opisthorchis viverrini]|uniref:Uncharacterized protein n=1 Tax=Opisthorchis viverrini TaxID=6198 RepID=A0A074ZRJ7_OPIVI|nr:hypothetical protein T265_03422 [Opisthorchis viverrini]KER30048.1 hypothetical protein T265_03422 [Opisthorchis viverrini]